MDESSDFATTLRLFMAQARRRPRDLEYLTNISARTIENWCASVVRYPREINDVLKIARALALSVANASTLLQAADKLPLDALWIQAQRAGDAVLLDLLAPWATELEQTVGTALRLPYRMSGTPPYCGLRTFQEADAASFFGRDALIGRLVAKIEQAPFLAVLGPSGSGKSSAVRAGLIPALKSGALPGSQDWHYAVLKPGLRPLDTLAAALAQLQGGSLGNVLALSQQLVTDERALLLASEVLRVSQPDAQLILVIDQFEELWTSLPTEDSARAQFVTQQRHSFLQLLLTTVTVPDPPARIVITLRADFLSQVAQHSDLAYWVSEYDVLVSPMVSQELRDVIVRPADAAGGHFEPGLVDELISQVEGRVGALPLLEYTLLELWQQRTDEQTLTWASYQALGGVEGALAVRAEQILADCYDPTQREQLRHLLLRLIQPGEGVADTRRRVPVADLVPMGSSVVEVQSLLSPLIGARLLTAGRELADDVATVEVAHEALIRAWPTLGQWISEARVDLRFQLQLEAAAQEWQRSGEHPDLLWTELRLANADAWLTRCQPLLNARDLAFLATSRARVQAQRAEAEAVRQRELAQAQERAAERAATARRLRWLVIGLVGVLGVTVFALIAAGVFGVQATQRAIEVQTQLRVAQSQRLAFVAQSQVATAPETALLLAYEAVEWDHNVVSEQALRNTLDGVIWWPRLLQGHTGMVRSATFSPDGQRIVTASWDGTARLWDRAGQELAILRGHMEGVESATFSPDGQRIVTASNDRTARLWDLNGQELATFQGHREVVWSATFSPDGQRIVTTSGDGTARVWDLKGQELATLRGHASLVRSATFSPDGQWIVTTSDDQTARVWDLKGHELTTIQSHMFSVRSATFSPDGQRIVTTSGDGTARLWDLKGHELTIFQGHADGVISATFSSDGQRIVTASEDGTARLWDLEGHELTIFQGHVDGVISATFSPDGQRIVTASEDGTARLWDVTGQELATLQGHTSSVRSATFSPDGQQIMTASHDVTARLWDVTGQELATLHGHTSSVRSATFSSDGQRIVTASEDGTARLWDLEGHELTALQGHADGVISATFSPDGQRIVTTSGDGTARLWDLNGQELATFRGHTDWVRSATFSPDGQWIVTASEDGTARLWDLNGQELVTFRGHTDWVRSATFSPDGQRIMTVLSGDGTARLWDLEGHELAILQSNAHFTSAIFSPDGQRIMTVSGNGTALLWDLAGRELATLQGHIGVVGIATFSPDGQRIAAALGGGMARLWDRAGQELATLQGHTDWVRIATFSPDGQRIVTVSDDGTARLWDREGQELAILQGHMGTVRSATFSPDGRRII